MRRLFRWAFRLLILFIILVVAGILLLNTIVKQVMESRLRAAGLDARIGQVDVGLLSPTLTIENLKIYNPADFGGSILIDMPELHMEYDPYAMRKGNLHFKLVRLDLAEVAIIQDKNGRYNVQQMQKKGVPGAPGKAPSLSSSGLTFTGIDTFNLSLGKFRLVNLATGHEEDVDFGIKNQISHNVKTEADLQGLSLLLAARAAMGGPSSKSPLDLSALLQILGRP
jgi:uncharacterized protein involved in outer membrane biogenesis